MIPIPPRLALWGAKHSASLLKYLGICLLFIGYSLSLYYLGKKDQKQEYAEQEQKEAIQAVKELKAEVGSRMETIEKKITQRAKLEGNINEGKKRYEEAVDKSKSNAACDLSPDELRELTNLVNEKGS